MNARIQQAIAVAGAVAVLSGAVSCGDVSRQGRGPSILVIDALQAASGASPAQFSGFLLSDVITKGSINDDPGKVTLRLVLKDLGSPAGEATPTTINQITINRYHVMFYRADGRNTQGV